jgi:membrane fusion protein, multidrug efflux system
MTASATARPETPNPGSNPMRSFTRPASLAVLVLAAACGRSAGAAEAAPESVVPVRTAEVVLEWVVDAVRATGTVHARDEIQLSFKSGGVVARVAVEEGDRVRRGQTLATLETHEVDAQVDRARSALAKAERDLARAQALFADSVATLQQVQDARTAAELARAEVQAAAFNRRHAAIVAPVDGVVLRRLAEGGELAAAGAPVLVVGSSERGMVLRAGVADRDAVRLRPGDRAVVRLEALPGRAFAGTVREVSPAADRATGTYRVEVALEPGGVPLVSGLVGGVELRPSSGAETAMVPIEAILEADGPAATVYTVADGRARRLAVTVGRIQGDRVAVTGGLDGVVRVVTDGAAYLHDGAAVREVP